MPPDEAEQRIQLIQRVLATGRMETYESRTEALGGLRDHESRMVPCGPDTVLLIARDITERKAVERLKGEFVATVSHELRTPITAIRGALGLLEAGVGGEIPPQATELLDLARANTERLLRLVNDILDFEKAEGGKLALDLQVMDLSALISTSVAAAGPFAASLGVSYAWEPGSQAAWARVDGVRFQQIMANLLSNAAKYSPKEAAVQVRLRKDGGWWRVEVENQGPPIPESFRVHVFERFAMADSTDARRRGGSGLGLAISHSLVHRMGGEIDFSSDPSGTCFFLRFAAEAAP
jgi:signal transduction histidine kinase